MLIKWSDAHDVGWSQNSKTIIGRSPWQIFQSPPVSIHVLKETKTHRQLASNIRKRQSPFFSYVIRRQKLEHVVTTTQRIVKRRIEEDNKGRFWTAFFVLAKQDASILFQTCCWRLHNEKRHEHPLQLARHLMMVDLAMVVSAHPNPGSCAGSVSGSGMDFSGPV